MKRTAILAILIMILLAQTAFADWAYRFVVYSGDVYVISDEKVAGDQLDRKIGEVTKFSDREDTYEGNFSNAFPKGTSYFAIAGTSTKEAIAVETGDNSYMKAVYDGAYRSNHFMSSQTVGTIAIVGVLFLFGVIAVYLVRRYKSR